MISNTCLNVLPRDIEFDFDWTALIICKIYPLNGVLYSDTVMSTHSVRYVKAYLYVCAVTTRTVEDLNVLFLKKQKAQERKLEVILSGYRSSS